MTNPTKNPHDLISFSPTEDAIGVRDLLEYLSTATVADLAHLITTLDHHEQGRCEPHDYDGSDSRRSGLCSLCTAPRDFAIHQVRDLLEYLQS